MKDKNIPILMVRQNRESIVKNTGGGVKPDYEKFGKYSEELRLSIRSSFSLYAKNYHDYFQDTNLPAVGLVRIKKDAIAKSYRPDNLLKYCPEIGGGARDELFISLTKSGIENTIDMLNAKLSKKLKYNMTVISEIEPLDKNAIISEKLKKEKDSLNIDIRIKLFDFHDEGTNETVFLSIISRLKDYSTDKPIRHYRIDGGIDAIAMQVKSYAEVLAISEIPVIRNISVARSFSYEADTSFGTIEKIRLRNDEILTDEPIAIIDGGISASCSSIARFIEQKDRAFA